MTCRFTGCPHAAAGLYTWGVYPDAGRHRDVPLCLAHAAELWDQLRGAVTTLAAGFSVRPPDDMAEGGR